MMGIEMNSARLMLAVTSILILAGCSAEPKSETSGTDDTPLSARDVRPLLLGAKIPQLTLKTVDGRAFDLNSAIAKKPAVLVFYRGGWCMYCNKHFGELALIEREITQLGFEIIAISPDKPVKLSESINKHQMGYTLLSDSDMKAAKAFGIAFKLNDELLNKYAEYGIDLDDASGYNHHLLPVPSVFVIAPDGTIKFQYVNPDYKTRLAPEVLLAALRAEATRD